MKEKGQLAGMILYLPPIWPLSPTSPLTLGDSGANKGGEKGSWSREEMEKTEMEGKNGGEI